MREKSSAEAGDGARVGLPAHCSLDPPFPWFGLRLRVRVRV